MGFYNGIYTSTPDKNDIVNSKKKIISNFVNILKDKSNNKINLINIGTEKNKQDSNVFFYELNIWDTLKIKFISKYESTSDSIDSYIYYKYNDTDEYKNLMQGGSSSANAEYVQYNSTNYSFTYLIVDNPTSLLLILPNSSYSPYNGNSNYYRKLMILILKQDNFTATLIEQDTDIKDIGYDSSTFYIKDTNCILNFYNSFRYIHNNNDITIGEKNLIYTTSNNVNYCYDKINTDILDCSEITPYSLVIVNNKKYFSMNSHTLIACE